MSTKPSFKSFLPHILAIVVFTVLTLIYFKPLLNGKALSQPDIDHYKGMSKEISDFRAKYHKEPLWTNSMFGGMPAFQISTEYPDNLINKVNNWMLSVLPWPAPLMLWYFLGFYVLLLTLDVDKWLSIVGAIAFGFSSFFFIIIASGHNSEAHAIGLMAPVLAGIILTFRGKYLGGGVLTALALALELNANHFQITYYLFLIILVYGIVQLVKVIKAKEYKPFLKAVGVLAIAMVLAIGSNFANIWCTYSYGKYTTRGKSELTFNHENKSSGLSESYATQWSYGKAETMTLLIPNFNGGVSEPIGNNKAALANVKPQMRRQVGSMEQYWGDQPFTSGPVYVGAIVLFLCILGLFVLDGSFKWFLFITTILSIMLSWGKNFPALTNLFFYHFPGYDKFRAVSMILVIAELTIPLLGILALDKLIKNKDILKEKVKFPLLSNPVSKQKLFFVSFILTGGIAFLCYIMPGAFTDFHKTDEYQQTFSAIKKGNPGVKDQQIRQYLDQMMPEVEKARESVFKSDALRSFILILLAAGLIWWYLQKKPFDKKWMYLTLTVFILADMWNVDKRYFNNDNFESKHQVQVPYHANQADLQIMQDTTPDYRVFNTLARLDQDSRTSYFHKSLGGYHGAKLKRYDELITYQLSRGNRDVVDMLNAKYIIAPGKNNQPVAQRNPGALGNAWFVDNYRLVANADSEMMALSDFDPAKTAIVDKRFKSYFKGFAPQKDTTASIKMLSYQPNDLVYHSSSSKEDLAVFSEIYYKDGWNAYIDGKKSPYIRVNYVLRAMLIPAGQHKIEFKFEPKEYFIGEKISLASSGSLLLLCLGFVGYEIKKKLAD